MRRVRVGIVTMMAALFVVLAGSSAQAPVVYAGQPGVHQPLQSDAAVLSPAVAREPYNPTVTGEVRGFRLAGVEPDGDPLYQVVLQMDLTASADIPAIHLFVSSYLENFTPDTTPLLPDLIHPGRQAQNLGGFLQGKVLLTDDVGDALYIGSFVADAFLDNSNHAAMQLFSSDTGYSGGGRLRGAFALDKNGVLRGGLKGSLSLSRQARQQLQRARGAKLKPVKEIISVVSVKPAPMMGRVAKGSPSSPLHTGFGSQPPNGSSRHLSSLTLLAAAGAIVSLLVALGLFWLERRKPAHAVVKG